VDQRAVSFGKRLRRLRLARGLTQRELASPSYTHAYVSTLEAGRRRPSAAALRHLAAKLGIEVEELVSTRPPGLTQELRAAVRDARIAASDGRLSDAAEALDQVVSRATRHRIPGVEAKAYEIRGLVLERTGRPDDALGWFERAEGVLEDRPPSERVDAVAGKARCLLAVGDISYAVFLLETLARSIAEERGPDADAVAHVHAALLDAYLDAGLLRSAAEEAEELRLVAPRLRDPVRQGQVRLYLARLCVTEGRMREAERLLAAAGEAYGRSGLKAETGYAHLALGYVLSREGKSKRARRELERARRIFEETRDIKDLARTLVELARVERTSGDATAAASLLEEAIALAQDADVPILAWAHRELGELHSSDEHGLAEKHLRTAAELFEGTDERVEAAVSYRLLGDVLRSSGQPAAALEAYRVGIRGIGEEGAGVAGPWNR
jgi:tetratricopeptide (TPR) repeat protein